MYIAMLCMVQVGSPTILLDSRRQYWTTLWGVFFVARGVGHCFGVPGVGTSHIPTCTDSKGHVISYCPVYETSSQEWSPIRLLHVITKFYRAC